MDGGHLVGMAGKLLLCRPNGTSHVLVMFFASHHDGLEAGGHIVNLVRHLAQLAGVF